MLDTHTRPKYLVIRLDEYETRKSDPNPRIGARIPYRRLERPEDSGEWSVASPNIDS